MTKYRLKFICRGESQNETYTVWAYTENRARQLLRAHLQTPHYEVISIEHLETHQEETQSMTETETLMVQLISADLEGDVYSFRITSNEGCQARLDYDGDEGLRVVNNGGIHLRDNGPGSANDLAIIQTVLPNVLQMVSDLERMTTEGIHETTVPRHVRT